MSVPVTSDGIRSGVNWIREKDRSSARESELMSTVSPSPGTPPPRQLPPPNSAISACSTTFSWPMITLRSSTAICLPLWCSRPASSPSSIAAGEEVEVTRHPFGSWVTTLQFEEQRLGLLEGRCLFEDRKQFVARSIAIAGEDQHARQLEARIEWIGRRQCQDRPASAHRRGILFQPLRQF